MPKIIDISQTIHPAMAVWPGDTEYKPFWVWRMDRGDTCNVGSVTMSLHTGTHADAPFHFLPDGSTMADVDLSAYIGPALVADVSGIAVIDANVIAELPLDGIERVLFCTQSESAGEFDPGFTYLTTDGAEALIAAGIKLVGIDTPSVDYVDSKTLDTHKLLAAHAVAILENLKLDHVVPGIYELIALPLKLAGMDGSPVRAILRTE